ncbi:growth-regulating factor 1-like isoform X2 [Hevea brasiliensis]|uniref:growth-regulating factor 1-like isoform X2 n=1 Tax=Hevea brasiliensis TaxID=3981 RepID=UPI0025FEC27D|nr:growth-regulating factor 1-like isoform X2 [Hevea brasiliensis]
MDFGVVGLEGLVGSDTSSSGLASLATSDPETKQKWYGSGFLKQERSVTIEDDWRSSKLSKTESMLLPQRNTLLKSNTSTASTTTTTTLFTDGQQQQQMLSFSCPKSEALSAERIPQNATLPYFHLTSSAYNRNTGFNYGSFNSANMHGVLTEARGPFTPSQWMELEHQALIYKYITANVPIPSNLLIPIRKALDSAGFSSFSVSWGTFHLGFSSNTDPEPGRCRRTDGKKWRCSRDAVADQKYCERHMNRGRHRSRKPVEGQSGHSVAAATSTMTAKSMPTASSSSMSAAVAGLRGSSGGSSNSLTIAQQQQQQLKHLQPDSSFNLSAATPLSRMFLDKEKLGERDRLQDSPGLSMLSSNIDLKSKENPFFVSKESSQIEFGLVNSDSLLNPSQNSSSLISCRNFGLSQDLTDQETVSQHSVRQFMDDWPKCQSDQSAVSWPQLDVQSDRTQLSISIPMAHTDYMSSTSSPNNEKVTLSPLRLCRDLDPVQMGLGVGSVLNEQNQRQANWIPISWETSMGGPLGEVLHNTNSSASECKSSSALNLMTEGWDSSPQIGSSPTGVLQKTTFASLSNSSAGSSPRAENNKTNEGASLCNDLLGSTLVHSSSLPEL